MVVATITGTMIATVVVGVEECTITIVTTRAALTTTVTTGAAVAMETIAAVVVGLSTGAAGAPWAVGEVNTTPPQGTEAGE